MNYSEAHQFLNSFTNLESKLHHIKADAFDLKRVEGLLDALGRPQEKLHVIHVAGTKGKGSTSAMVASILRAAGFSVGLYTSPHLYQVNERIRILRPGQRATRKDFEGKISDDDLAKLTEKIKPKIKALGKSKLALSGVPKLLRDEVEGLTYFEVMTALAFCHFAHEKVDFVVLETGLGGRLDATNVADAMVSVITPISFDHTALLGNTIRKIAAEKAAIIKSSKQRVVIAEQPKEAMDVILKRCREFSIRPLRVGKDVAYRILAQNLNGQKVIMSFPRKRESSLDPRLRGGDKIEVRTCLLGTHQAQNAARAVAVIECLRRLGFEISNRDIQQGIQSTRWPARFEILSRNPVVLADGAHNVASAKALVKTIQELWPRRKLTLILGVSQDKDIVGICRALNPIVDSVIAARSPHPRARAFKEKEIQNYFKGKNTSVAKTAGHALRDALRAAGSRGVIVVTGSLFVAAHFRRIFLKK